MDLFKSCLDVYKRQLQLIVGQAVTQAANDKKQLLPMVATVEKQAGQKPSQVLALSLIHIFVQQAISPPQYE